MNQRCAYQYRQDHIHEITFYASSRDAVDEWIGNLDVIYAYEEKAPLLLIDFTRSGLPPVGYFLTRLRQWQHQNPRAHLGRCAVVYEGNMMLLSLLKSTMLVLGVAVQKRTQLFNSYAYTQAVDWLNQAHQDYAPV